MHWMCRNMFIMVRMICFSYQYSKESGYAIDLDNSEGVSPQEAMEILFGVSF